MNRHRRSAIAVALLFAAVSIGRETASGQIGNPNAPNSNGALYGGYGRGPYAGYGGWYGNYWNGPGLAGGYWNGGNSYYGYGNGPYGNGFDAFPVPNYNPYGNAPYNGYNGNGYGIENWDNVYGTSPVRGYWNGASSRRF